MREKLTKKQKLIIRKLTDHLSAKGTMPTYKEIAQMSGTTIASAYKIIQRIVAKRFLEKTPDGKLIIK